MCRSKWVIVGCAAVAVGLLVVSHWVHALGVLPYIVLLACPLLHLLHRHDQPPSRAARAEGAKPEVKS